MIRRTLSILRKALLVGLTLGGLLSVVACLASVHANASWVTYTEPDVTPLPVLSVHGVGATLSDNILYVGNMPAPQGPLSGDEEKLFSWFVEYRTNLGHVGGSPAQWRPLIHSYGPGAAFSVSIPLWVMTLAFAAYPTIAFIRGPLMRWRRRRRRKRGLCIHCGYDQRGTPERCPECGDRP